MSALITYTQAVHNCDSFQTHLNWPVKVHVLQLTIPNDGCDCMSSLINTGINLNNRMTYVLYYHMTSRLGVK